MQSAASAAVLDVARKAFMSLPQVNEAAPTTGAETAAIPTEQAAAPRQLSASDHANQAVESMTAGDMALAVAEYQRAVNADPSNSGLRLKLAEAFAKKGMYDEADSELARALLLGADKADVDSARSRIEDMKKSPEQQETGTTTSQVPEARPATPDSASAPASADETDVPSAQQKPETAPEAGVAGEQKMVFSSPKQAVALMTKGDQLWKQGDSDGAADAYREAIKQDPSDWRSYERLSVVCAYMSMFNESLTALEQLKKVQPDPPSYTIESRYNLYHKAIDEHFQMLLRQYDTDSEGFDAGKITHESYYNTVKGLSLRLESVAKFIDALDVPAAKQPANLHRSLACGLMAQAASNLLDYLETNSHNSRKNADVFASQARKELDEAIKLETKGVTVDK